MKSGLPGLYDLCKWAVSNNFLLGFSRVNDDPDPGIRAENIFDYPELLNDVSGWQDIFHDCIAFLYKSNYDKAADQLFFFFSLLTKATALNFSGEFALLFDKKGSDLAKQWEYNLYGSVSAGNRPDAGKVLITTKEDHIALPMISGFGSERDREHYFDITIAFPESEHSCSYVYALQNQDYAILKKFTIDARGGGIYKTVQYIPPTRCEAVRLVLYPVSTGLFVLPEKLVVNVTNYTHVAGQHAAWTTRWFRLGRKLGFLKDI
jgi:hypothetical protein